MSSLMLTVLWFLTTLHMTTGKMGPKTPQRSDFARCRLTEVLKEQFLDAHNKYRGEVQPSAADMEYLEWSDDVANLAQMWTDKCEWMHGFTKFGDWHPNQIYRSKSVGQNLAREWGKWLEREVGPVDAVRRWFIEKDHYTFGKFAYPMPSWMCRKEPCGHYTQVAWAKSKQVGCALKWCDKDFDMPHPWIPGETVVTCDYYPSGNVVGQLPYTRGTPCTRCASGKGWCYENLCRECKNFSPECGKKYTKRMCLTQRDLMEKHCPQMCNLCQCPLQCKNGGQLDRSTCTCTCYGKWKGLDCTEKICDQGWYGENCNKRCYDLKGTSTCKWRVQNGHPCSRGYMKVDCVKTCICDLMPTPRPRPTNPPTTTPKVTAKPAPATPPAGGVCKDKYDKCEEVWAKNGFCRRSSQYHDWMKKNCMKSCGVCTCQDVHNTADCKRWAQNGECQKNSVWMEVNCPKSCLVCDCHDKRTKCGEWTKSGYCVNKYVVWMSQNCAKSCDKCE